MQSHNTDTVSMAAALDLIDACLNGQLITEHELKAMDIATEQRENLTQRIPEASFIKLWHILTQHPRRDIALLIGRTINPNAKGLLASWVSQTASLEEALTIFITHISLMNPSEHWQFKHHKKTCTLSCEIAADKNYPQQAIERSMSAMITWGKLLSGNGFTVEQVDFCCDAPSYVDTFIDTFSCNVKFNQKQNGIMFASELLKLPVLSSNVLLRDMVENKAKQALQQLHDSASLPEKVSAIIVDLMEKENDVNIQVVSDGLSMSRQTLYRGLKKHETDFQSLFNKARKHKAILLITEDKDSIDRISIKLGFKDNSSFYKAFKRWTGQSPSDFKREQ